MINPIQIKGKRFNWTIEQHSNGTLLCVDSHGDSILVAHCHSLQEAIQEMMNIETEEVANHE